MSEIITLRLACGAALVIEPIPNVASVALNWRVPAGAATDPEGEDGFAGMLGEMIFRGAGGLTSREHSDALDRLGLQRSSHTRMHHLELDATLLGRNLAETLPLLVGMLRAPAFPDDAIEPVRSLCLQTLEGLEDEPQSLAMIRLRERHLPPPFGRHGYGERAVLEAASIEGLRRAWTERCVAGGSILAVAGAVEPTALVESLNRLLEGWGGDHSTPRPTAAAARGYHHFDLETAQVHIGLAYDAPRAADDDAILERLATAVLSGSTSGRLFSEVRQKRSLCYSVGASYRAGRDAGHVALYAGTTPERAQETLDVCRAEIERLFTDTAVSEAEFDRAVTGLKSHLVMQGESTPARSAALAHDHFRRGQARTLAALVAEIDAVTRDALHGYLRRRTAGPYTIVSIGPEALDPGGARSAPVAAAGE